MTDMVQLVAHLRAGNWEAAHDLVQDDQSVAGAWAHGIVHMLEGDMANAGYWYRRAGRALPVAENATVEIEDLALSVKSRREGRKNHDGNEESGHHSQ